MFQQLLANKHHRLRDSVPITIWPSGGLRLVTDKKIPKKKKNNNNKSRAKQEPRSAHGRVVNYPSFDVSKLQQNRLGRKKLEKNLLSRLENIRVFFIN